MKWYLKLLLICQAVLCVAALSIPFGIIKEPGMIKIVLLLCLFCSGLLAFFLRESRKAKTDE